MAETLRRSGVSIFSNLYRAGNSFSSSSRWTIISSKAAAGFGAQ